jgi:tryptophan-rich sensory protein
MGRIWQVSKESRKQIAMLFLLQWILNVSWNPVFFHFHWMGLGLAVILLLETIVIIKHLKFSKQSIVLHFLIVPYIIWLVIAFSLNAFAWLYA